MTGPTADGTLLDRHMADVWPPAVIVPLGRSRLRWAWGLTRRANSVLAAGDLDDAGIGAAEAFYAGRRAPARFQLTTASAPSALGGRLASSGYERDGDTTVLWAPLEERTAPGTGERVELDPAASAEWFAVYWAAEHRRYGRPPEGTAERYTTTLLRPAGPVAFARVVRGAATVAVGQGVVRDRWLALQCMATLSGHRRTGAATAVLAALARWGRGAGATSAHLAVLDGNAPARRLYERAGFRPSHTYAYWTRGAAA